MVVNVLSQQYINKATTFFFADVRVSEKQLEQAKTKEEKYPNAAIIAKTITKQQLFYKEKDPNNFSDYLLTLKTPYDCDTVVINSKCLTIRHFVYYLFIYCYYFNFIICIYSVFAYLHLLKII